MESAENLKLILYTSKCCGKHKKRSGSMTRASDLFYWPVFVSNSI
jgi:hypothetical protein